MTKNIISVIASQSTIFIEAKGRVVCLQTCENFAWEQKHSAVSNLSNLIHKCNVHRVQSKLFTLNVQSNSPTERKEEKVKPWEILKIASKVKTKCLVYNISNVRIKLLILRS